MASTVNAAIVLVEGSAETFQTGPVTVKVLEDGSNTDNRIGSVEITIPAHTEQTPLHYHNMHDETFLVIKGSVRFTTDKDHYDVATGGYIVAPIKAPHTFSSPFDEDAIFLNTFTPAYYVNYLREVYKLASTGELTVPGVLAIMARYATEPVKK